MYIKKLIVSVLLFLISICILWGIFFSSLFNQIIPPKNKEVLFRSHDQQIQIKKDGQWSNFEVKGINLGTGYPGVFPNEYGIDQATYYRWFQQIAAMNANVVRLYKLQSPMFYNALYQYNQNHEKKLYIIQGIDFSDYLMYSEDNISDARIQSKILNHTYDVIDAVHGKNVSVDNKDMMLYTKNVSDYLLGYMLGVEWDDMFVEYTCTLNNHLKAYDGTYLKTAKDANPFEVLMAKWGDETLKYEKQVWGKQSLISYCNWPDTDALKNEFESDENHDAENQWNVEPRFDVDKIITKDNLQSGIFVSYNVYPYFPYFLQIGEYTTYIDDSGKRNPYQKYIKDLVDHHNYPLVISEYGVATSRSETYQDIWRNINHGGTNERQQGAAIRELYRDIKKAKCAGSILFSWQDEWYKKTWNNEILSDSDRRAFWSNAQCAEQSFGLLTFEPGEKNQTIYPDGNLNDWENIPLLTQEHLKLKVHSDEKYMYFLIEDINWDKVENEIEIAIDTLPKSGAKKYKNHKYPQGVEFIISISKAKKATLKVQDYYDTLVYSIAGADHDTSSDMIQNIYDKIGINIKQSDTDNFSIVTCAKRDIITTLQRKWEKSDAGILTHGNANPDSKNFNSNADFYCSEDAVEIRIPWQLLNFYDPSKKVIIDDFKKNDYKIHGLTIDHVYASAYTDQVTKIKEFGEYKLSSWKKPTFHERLKKSYYVVQEMFKEGE